MKLPKASRKRLAKDFVGAELGDERRVARLLQIVEALGRQPQAPLPDVFETEAELKAAYRFFGSEAFDFDDLLEEHRARSAERAEATRRVIVVHDTTSCEHAHIAPEELGFLATGKAGFLLHVSLVIDAEHHRRPLGVIYAEPLFRAKRSRRGGRKLRLSGTESAKWADREFLRWNRGVEASAELLQDCQAVHVMDREGDCYALFSELIGGEHSFVVRCRTNRTLADATKLDEHLKGISGVLDREVQLSRRAESRAPSRRKALPARPTRKARLRFKASTVEIARPRSTGSHCLPTITMNVVRVEEEGAPDGHKPVQWTLWTSLPVDSPSQIADVVDIYRQRWVIEEYFKTLKTGCSYESRLLESRNALLNLLAVTMPIAVEVLWMRARATDAPDAPAEEVVTPLQIEILRKLGHRPLSASPTAAEVLLCVASIGGHQRNNGSPGWLVLKRGYEKLLHYEVGWTAALVGRRRKM